MKKETSLKKTVVNMPLVNPNAAGIDIGDTIHAVAVPVDRDKVHVKSFGAMTCDLEEIIIWLHYWEIDTIAMESRVFEKSTKIEEFRFAYDYYQKECFFCNTVQLIDDYFAEKTQYDYQILEGRLWRCYHNILR